MAYNHVMASREDVVADPEECPVHNRYSSKRARISEAQIDMPGVVLSGNSNRVAAAKAQVRVNPMYRVDSEDTVTANQHVGGRLSLDRSKRGLGQGEIITIVGKAKQNRGKSQA